MISLTSNCTWNYTMTEQEGYCQKCLEEGRRYYDKKGREAKKRILIDRRH